MADYLASLAVSAFVLDYDHNAPSAEYLDETHEAFFEAYRKQKPDTPVILVSRPNIYEGDADTAARREIIRRTWEHARKRGDGNVFFVDGEDLFRGYGISAADCTVDGCHPNDLGFWRMAEKIGAALKPLLV